LHDAAESLNQGPNYPASASLLLNSQMVKKIADNLMFVDEKRQRAFSKHTFRNHLKSVFDCSVKSIEENTSSESSSSMEDQEELFESVLHRKVIGIEKQRRQNKIKVKELSINENKDDYSEHQFSRESLLTD
jgi:hypothetical protein